MLIDEDNLSTLYYSSLAPICVNLETFGVVMHRSASFGVVLPYFEGMLTWTIVLSTASFVLLVISR